MALKTILLSVAFLALFRNKPVWCAVGEACTAGGNECAATEKCDSNKCAARTSCDPSTDCNNHGTCAEDFSCTCNAGYTGNDCSKECHPVCVNGKCKLEVTDPKCDCTGTGFAGDACNEVTCDSNTKCTLPKVCVGPANGRTCIVDPCEGTPCGDNGECSYDKTVTNPSFVCTCKNGYGGTTCTDEPECTKSEDCTDDAKPECKKEEGKQSVCAEKNDPCEGTPCGDNGECSYDKTVTNPSFVCTCKNGYGGTTCTDEPECTKSEDCTDDAKPECKKEEGKQSVCAEKTNGGNNVAATPGILLAVLLAAFYL